METGTETEYTYSDTEEDEDDDDDVDDDDDLEEEEEDEMESDLEDEEEEEEDDDESAETEADIPGDGVDGSEQHPVVETSAVTSTQQQRTVNFDVVSFAPLLGVILSSSHLRLHPWKLARVRCSYLVFFSTSSSRLYRMLDGQQII